jgi:hypothetical protein
MHNKEEWLKYRDATKITLCYTAPTLGTHSYYEIGEVPIQSRYIPPALNWKLPDTLTAHIRVSWSRSPLFRCLTGLTSPKINMTVPRRFDVTVP